MALFVFAGLGAGLASADVVSSLPAAPGQSVEDDLSKFGSTGDQDLDDVELAELAPDLTLLVDLPADLETPWVVATRTRLLADPSVRSVSVDFPTADQTGFHLWVDLSAGPPASIQAVAARLADVTFATVEEEGETAALVRAGGRQLADASIISRFNSSVSLLAVLTLLLAAAVGWRFSWKRGALIGLGLVGSTVLAGRVAVQVVGSFDGTVATTPLVGALAGLVLALVVALRLLRWYENPPEADGATLIQFSLHPIAVDVALVLGSLIVVSAVLWVTGGSAVVMVGAVVGGLVGAAFTAAVVGPGLAALQASDRQSDSVWPYPIPSGGQLMLLTVLGLLGLLLVLAAFAFRAPGLDLIDYRALPDDHSARVVGETLGAGPGDPTEAIVANFDDGTAEQVRTWAEAVATLPSVAWVDTQSLRFTGAEIAAVDPRLSIASEEQLGLRSSTLSVIVPAVPIRSAEGAALIDELVDIADDRVELAGAAGSMERGSTTLVVASVVFLALVAAAVVFVETNNAGYAVTSFALRLLGGAAAIGVYRLVASDASAAETIAVVVVVGLLAGLFELEFLRDRARKILAPAGLASLLSAAAMVVAGVWIALGRFWGGGPTVGRFGLALSFGLLIEVALGFVVFRPILLGERAVYHAVARPVRNTLHSGTRAQRGRPLSVDDPTWRRRLAELLVAEFGLQTDPTSTNLEEVFLDGTPLHRQAAEQHQNLLSAGLRVSGQAPKLRRVETLREGPSSMVSVTVDHPERHLVDYSGRVYGVRRPQRRSMMLWLVSDEPGQYLIAESIELGAVALDGDSRPPDSPAFPDLASVSG